MLLRRLPITVKPKLWPRHTAQIASLLIQSTASQCPMPPVPITNYGTAWLNLVRFFFDFWVPFLVPFLGPEIAPPALSHNKEVPKTGPISGPKNGTQNRTKKQKKNNLRTKKKMRPPSAADSLPSCHGGREHVVCHPSTTSFESTWCYILLVAASTRQEPDLRGKIPEALFRSLFRSWKWT